MIRLLIIPFLMLLSLHANEELLLTPMEHQYLQSKKEITICFNAKGLPLYGVEKAKDIGIFPDTVALIEKKLGIPFQTVRTKSWKECIALSKKNEVDISGLILLSPRKHLHLLPSNPVLEGYIGLATKIQEPLINNISELKDKKIALFSGQSSINAFVKRKLPNNDFVMVTSVEEGLKMLTEGKVYAFADESYSLAYHILKLYSNELKIMKKLNRKPLLAGLGIRKNEPELLKIINKAIASIDSQTFRDISHKWISVRVEKGFDYILLMEIVSVLLLILGVSIYWTNRLSKEVRKRQDAEKALQKLNENLEEDISAKIKELHYKDAMLQEQTKLAAMGEMIGAIAHQWRRPLSTLHINIEMLEQDYKDGKCDESFLEDFVEKNSEIIQYMSHTIDDFQNFYKIDKVKTDFDVREKIQSVLDLHMNQLEENGIHVLQEGEDFSVFGYPSEFQQVILNLVSNAKDALIERKVKEPFIKISMSKNASKGYIRISDNAGGVKKEMIEKMFEPYFTTKEETGGTGLGLYMSKMIIEKNMQGKLSVANKEDGVEVLIVLEREDD